MNQENDKIQTVVIPEAEDRHWRRVMVFLQEAGTIIDFLLRRVYCKRSGEDLSEPALYAQAADDDGELTDELIVKYLSAIARQARAGFVEGDGFPVFVPMEDYLRQLEGQFNTKKEESK